MGDVADDDPIGPLGVPGDVARESLGRGQQGERLGAVAEVFEVGIRARPAAIAGVGVVAEEVDQAVGLVERQRPQHHPVDQGVDGGHRAEAERQGEHHDDGETGSPRQVAGGETEVLDQGNHSCISLSVLVVVVGRYGARGRRF